MEIEITIKKVFTEDNLKSIIKSALKGIAYWTVKLDVKDVEFANPDLVGDYIVNGGTLLITVIGNETHELNLENLKKGIEILFEKEGLRNEWDFDEIDGDHTIQYAFFGKLIY